MNYYQHHIGDHLIATAHLSALEDGIYRRLMDRYYATELPLCLDEAMLFRVMRVHTDDERNAVRTMLNEFFTRSDSGWRHTRCEQDITAFKEKSAKSTEAANRRWQKTDQQDAAPRRRPSKPDAPRQSEPIREGVSPRATKSASGSATNAAADAATDAATDAASKPGKRAVSASRSERNADANASQATRLPADWQPSDVDIAFCRTHRPDLQPMAVASQFRDYWIAQPGVTGKKADWSATWRNWVRNERGTPPVRTPSAYQSNQERRQAFADALTGRNQHAPTPTMIDLNDMPH
jgi:uncharacterized protein YdaU (DUF1376 family)